MNRLHPSYRVSFLEPSLDALFFLNRFVDVSFLFDMLLNFYMGFFDELKGKWVYDLKAIRARYVESWFLIDIVSILPFDAIGLFTESDSIKRLKAGTLSTIRYVFVDSLNLRMLKRYVYTWYVYTW